MGGVYRILERKGGLAMKRGVCFLMALLLVTLSLSWSVFAISVWANEEILETEADSVAPSFFSNTVDFSCRLDVDTLKIHVGGMIQHDVFVTHSDYTIEVYAIPPGEDAETIVNNPDTAPVAGSAITIKFEFALDAKDILSKYSRYCVVLRSSDGEHLLCSEPKFAEVASTFSSETEDRSAYKGIATSQIAGATHAGAGRVIIPLYFDRLLSSTSNGYVYGVGGENLYFDKTYIENLDVSIRTATASGTEVYLQYILFSDYTNVLPNVYDTDTLTLMESITSFLCARYESLQNGMISGIVVGKAVDTFVPYYTTMDAVTSYAEQYALCVIAVANTARRLNPEMDIVLSFSSVNAYGGTTGRWIAAALLEGVISVLDRGFSNPFACTSMIESDTVPLIYPEGWLLRERSLEAVTDNDTLHAGNLEIYARYLDELRTRHESVPQSFMFVWEVPDTLSGNALGAAYAYSYFRLIAKEQIASFIVSFTERERQGNKTGFSELSHLYTYIDTDESASVTKNLLSYFDGDSWETVCDLPYDGSYVLRTLYRTTPSFDLPAETMGSFSYFDFSTSVNLSTWFMGHSCNGIRLNYHGAGGKALQMDMLPTNGEYAEVFCLYEYPENLIYTPYIAFRVGIESKGEGASDALYEITITSGSGRTSAVASTSVQTGGIHTIVLDLSAFSETNMSDYWRISVRPLDDRTSEYALWLYDVIGYSTEYDTDELSDLIESERLRIRNLENPTDENDDSGANLWMMIGVVGIVLLLGIFVFILLRVKDENRQEEGHSNHNE